MSDQPRAATREVTLPSGLSGIMRRMKMAEYDLLTSRSAVRKGVILEGLFERVWADTLDLGIYQKPFAEFATSDEGVPRIDWLRVLQGDRNILLVELRKLTRGTDFDFDVACRLCRKIIHWRVDLEDLQVYPLAQEALDQLRETGKNYFERQLPYSGDTVAFKLLQGVDQNQLATVQEQNPDTLFSATMLQRLVYIPGADKPKDRQRYVAEMDGEDIDYLRQEWNRLDCDMQTTVTIECPTCSKIQEVALPLDEDFFLRRQSQTRRTSDN